jgi:autotransporter-associated beta strand protein
LNIASNISDGAGAFGFSKTGTGTINLSGNNSYDGVTNISVGVLAISSSTALGSATGGTSIAATGSTTTGGQLRLNGDIALAENITITGTTEAGSFARVIDSTSGTNTLSGSITLVGTGQVRLGPAAGTLQFGGSIARSGTDVGPLMLAPATGATVIIAQPIDTNGGNFNVTGGGTVELNAISTDLGNTAIFFGASSPNGPVVKLGAHHALPTTRNITLGSNSTSNGADKGTLDLAGFNQTINALIGIQGTGATPSAASTRRVTNSAIGTISTLTVGNANGSGTFHGLIEDGAGKVSLIKTGSGTLTLPTAHTYTGDTAVTGGTLSIANATLADTADVNLTTGSVLNLTFTGADSIDQLRISGLAQPPGTWGSLASTATHKTALITGAGLLQITGPQPPYDAWALAGGLDGTPAKDASLTADSDNDGTINLIEYATKMNPSVSDVVPQSFARNGNTLEFHYSRNKAATDVTTRVEWSDTLAPGSWSQSGVTEQIVGDNGMVETVRAIVPSAPGRRFVRLEISKP